MSRGRPERDPDPALHPDRLALARELRDCRKASGMTVREVADKAHCSPSSVSHAESGKRLPSPGVFRCIVRATGGNAASPLWSRLYAAATLAATSLAGLFHQVYGHIHH
ncbi:helix-turn-helix transcriptional regulator [Embleya sp. NBC_00896]|uniref:helix-turn-helix domain-containing protein n=1 Tax=Embleya sp. NBC_00896 TaxID=2975961 RepID=UPI002F91873B|nr:helix-turn-helix transcriptional regulator [Embleya sp. NBC_00896]